MPYLFYQNKKDTNTDWQAVELPESIVIEIDGDEVRFGKSNENAVPRFALVSHANGGFKRYYSLISPFDLRINGKKIIGSIRVLNNHDEIQIERKRFYFSDQSLVKIESFKNNGKNVPCAMCGGDIHEGQYYIRCPVCGIMFHQDDDRPCFTFSGATCPSVGCPFTLPVDFENQALWTPEPDR